jgi:hypothetical protein
MPTQRARLSDRPKFSVVIIYEDRGTGRRAKYFYEKLVHELKGKCDFSLELWDFQVLAISEIGNSAARVAAQADFLIVSLHGKAGLPAEIREWIETWARLIADSNAALIALVDKLKRGMAALLHSGPSTQFSQQTRDRLFTDTFSCRSTN